MDGAPEILPSISRRKVMSLGIATGVAIAVGPTKNAMAKAPCGIRLERMRVQGRF